MATVRTRSGRVLTEKQIEELARRMEAGPNLGKARRRGRPSVESDRPFATGPNQVSSDALLGVEQARDQGGKDRVQRCSRRGRGILAHLSYVSLAFSALCSSWSCCWAGCGRCSHYRRDWVTWRSASPHLRGHRCIAPRRDQPCRSGVQPACHPGPRGGGEHRLHRAPDAEGATGGFVLDVLELLHYLRERCGEALRIAVW